MNLFFFIFSDFPILFNSHYLIRNLKNTTPEKWNKFWFHRISLRFGSDFEPSGDSRFGGSGGSGLFIPVWHFGSVRWSVTTTELQQLFCSALSTEFPSFWGCVLQVLKIETLVFLLSVLWIPKDTLWRRTNPPTFKQLFFPSSTA